MRENTEIILALSLDPLIDMRFSSYMSPMQTLWVHNIPCFRAAIEGEDTVADEADLNESMESSIHGLVFVVFCNYLVGHF